MENFKKGDKVKHKHSRSVFEVYREVNSDGTIGIMKIGENDRMGVPVSWCKHYDETQNNKRTKTNKSVVALKNNTKKLIEQNISTILIMGEEVFVKFVSTTTKNNITRAGE